MSRDEQDKQQRIYREMSNSELVKFAHLYEEKQEEDAVEHLQLIEKECSRRSECYL